MTDSIKDAIERQLARRLDCTVCGATDSVRIELGSNAPGDVLVWRCGHCGGEWFETGQPRSIPTQTVTDARRDEILRKNRAQVKGTASPLCPECKVGKHPNCDGSAWDLKLDELAECWCPACGKATP